MEDGRDGGIDWEDLNNTGNSRKEAWIAYQREYVQRGLDHLMTFDFF